MQTRGRIRAIVDALGRASRSPDRGSEDAETLREMSDEQVGLAWRASVDPSVREKVRTEAIKRFGGMVNF